MTSFPYRPHLRNPHLSTPSPTEILTLHGEGIRRQTSHLNLDQEIFGHAPGIPTPPNVSPLSGTSFVGLLPRHASLLSPDDDPRTSSRSQLLLPGSSTTVRSTAPTISQPVQSGVPLRTEHECLPGNTTHRHQAQPKDTGPASGGRSVGLCGRLLRVFRAPFRALLCIPKRPAAEPPRHAPSVSLESFRSASFLLHVDSTVIQSRRQSRDKVKNGGHVELRNTDRDSADGEKAIPTTTPNNRSAPIPPPLSSLHAFEVSLSKRGRLPVITSDGVGKEWVHTEAIIGTPEQQPSADLGSYMPTAQPNSLAPNSGFPCSDTSAGPPKTLYREVSRHYPTICSNPSHS